MQQLTQLTTTQLCGTGLKITRTGFGAWAMVERLQTVAVRHYTTPGAVADVDDTNQPAKTR